MPELVVRLPKLHTMQMAIRDSSARFKVLACGRRSGKTTLAGSELADRAIQGQRLAYFAPTYSMIRVMWSFLEQRIGVLIKSSNKQEGRIELVTGGIIDFWSLNTTSADSVRSNFYHMAILDEAAYIPDLANSFYNIIFPLLADKQGSAWFLSTPNGHNGFWQFYLKGIDSAESLWESFHYPTSINPYIPLSEIELQQKQMPERAFQQEYLAEFTDDGGGVFRGVKDVSVLEANRQAHGLDYVMGVDWGKANDFTVLCVFNRLTMQQVYLERFNQISWALQRGRLADVARHFRVSYILAESNSIGEPQIEELQREGLNVYPFAMTAQSKTPLIDDLALAIERQQIRLLNDPVQLAELQSYQMERLPSGAYRYNAPSGSHDDTVIALALAYRAAINSGQALYIDMPNIFGRW